MLNLPAKILKEFDVLGIPLKRGKEMWFRI